MLLTEFASDVDEIVVVSDVVGMRLLLLLQMLMRLWLLQMLMKFVAASDVDGVRLLLLLQMLMV